MKEFKDMREKKVWKVVEIKDKPLDRRLIGCRWVNKRKRNGVYRARLVALGYSQIPGVDFTDSFVPVIHDTTFRLLCVLIVVNGWIAEIVDIETEFLYGDLEEVIYMTVPEGYETIVKDDNVDRSKHCLQLVKTIYGLSQAARQFYKKLVSVLTIESMKMKNAYRINACFMRKRKTVQSS